jgi:hypothetical protein
MDSLQAGVPSRREQPVWEPLLELLGLELVDDGFMWMGGIELEDGLEVHAYKHFSTRRYLHVGVDGRLFAYHSPGLYEEIALGEALAEVFTGWESATPGLQHPAAVRALLECHAAVASQEMH